jgi:hypothetical protein
VEKDDDDEEEEEETDFGAPTPRIIIDGLNNCRIGSHDDPLLVAPLVVRTLLELLLRLDVTTDVVDSVE